ncbi:MAG: hypothetical protein KAJ10_11635 [Thermodesulfovibrionia bacterium]|nr:hypothetical protein [Thermodesulfovibrionia bacterium]
MSIAYSKEELVNAILNVNAWLQAMEGISLASVYPLELEEADDIKAKAIINYITGE